MRSVILILILAFCALGLVSSASAEETAPGLVNGTLQNLSTASSHFQAGLRQINGDVNLSNATTELANARSTVENFIGAFNDLIQIVNRILGLGGNIRPAPGNPTGP